MTEPRSAAGPDRRHKGRRKGHALSARRQALVDTLLPRLRPALGGEGAVDLRGPLPGHDRLWLEVGFGGGEHLAWQAGANPDVTMIGAEPFLNGVASLLAHVDDGGLDNVRILDSDVRPLLDALPEASLERIVVLFPDPWPKTRHHKRRIVNRETARRFAALLADGGELRLATDIMDHARWMMAAVWPLDDLVWQARGPDDWRIRPDDWPETRYEAKARRAGRASVFLRFRRRPRAMSAVSPVRA
ncbi:MAG: tRNA (guanosine(46)-N7)-methyltransferase TrmB [Rhodospirillales bacterium]|nr:tRNA (guanosine(46)-N7)-methyltransferase TrmB [Rhodospirillales bacterium]